MTGPYTNFRTVVAAVFLFLLFSSRAFAQTKAAGRIPRPVFGFVENRGQLVDQNNKLNKDVRFLLSLRNLKVQLRANGFSYETFAVEGASIPQKSFTQFERKSTRFHYHRVDISFPGASASPEIVAAEPLAAALHYYTAAIAEGGVTVSSYRKITYRNIYEGIDLVFEVDPSKVEDPLEYSFVINPGADATKIRMKYDGAYETKLEDGKIAIKVAGGTFSERIPRSYIENENKAGLKNVVQVTYESVGKDEYRFCAIKYDRTKTLVIDPTPDLVWGTYYGAWGNDFSEAIAKDAANNLFICGNTDDQSFVTTAGAFQNTLDGTTDAVIGKFTNGGALVWFTLYGGSSFDNATGIKIDAGGNVIVTGQTSSYDVIATPGAWKTVNTAATPGRWTAFVAKFDNNGNRIWGTYFGGNYADVSDAVATDSKSNIIIAGYTESKAWLATPGAWQTIYAGDTVTRLPDAFVAKFDPNGALLWATYFGGSGYDLGIGDCVDASDNILLTGSTNSPTGMTSPGCWQPVIGSLAPVGTDGYLAKFDPAGRLLWSTYYGGSGSDVGYAVVVDGAGDIVFGGSTNSPNNMATSGTLQPTVSPSDGVDFQAFVAKFNSGGQRIWGTYYGNGGSDIVMAITTDPVGNIYTGGQSASQTDITTPGAYQPQRGQYGPNACLAKWSPSGQLLWGTFYGTPGGGWTAGIVYLDDGSAVVTGITSSTNGIATCGAVDPTYTQFNDIFLGKFSEKPPAPGPSISISASGTGPVCPNTPITFTATPDNGGTSPDFQWHVNGKSAGANSATFTSSGLSSGDSVSCFLTSNSVCVTDDTASSNVIDVALITPTTPTVSISGLPDTICQGAPANFTATGTTQSATPNFQWLVNGIYTGITGISYSSTTLQNGDKISCVVTDAICGVSTTGYSNTVAMTVNNNILNPALRIETAADAVCANTNVVFDAQASGAGADPHYQWAVNGQPAGADTAFFGSSSLQQGDQIGCTITPGYAVCWNADSANSNTVTMTVYAIPAIAMSPADTAILAGSSFVPDASIVGNIATYNWEPATGVSNPSIPDPVVGPDTSTVYQLKVTSVDGCSDSAKLKVIVERNLHLPNAFTPGKPGKNSVFRIPPFTSINLSEFSVYDRWGARVFSTTDPNVGWDGTSGGIRCPAGTYVYFVAGSDTRGKLVAKGTILLIR